MLDMTRSITAKEIIYTNIDRLQSKHMLIVTN